MRRRQTQWARHRSLSLFCPSLPESQWLKSWAWFPSKLGNRTQNQDHLAMNHNHIIRVFPQPIAHLTRLIWKYETDGKQLFRDDSCTVSANSSICLRLGTLWSSMRTLSTRPWKNDVSYVFSLHRLNILYLRGKGRNQIKLFVEVILNFAKPVLVLRLQESGHFFYWVPEQEGGLNRESTEP